MAVQRVEQWLDASIAAYQTIGVETVLSSGKYRRLVASAQDRGFELRMIYVVLDSLALQLRRTRQRVADGGHDVPADKVEARRQRSFEQLAWFARHVDRCLIFNNSTGQPELAAVSISRGPLWQYQRLPSDLAATMRDQGVDLRAVAR